MYFPHNQPLCFSGADIYDPCTDVEGLQLEMGEGKAAEKELACERITG